MIHRPLRCVGGLLLAAGLLSACGTDTAAVRVAQQATLPAYAEARAGVPAPPPGALRLVVYRPQALVGLWGSAMLRINGRWLGDPEQPVTDNRLIPGAVFVVDVPAGSARITWAQRGRPEGTDAALELAAVRAPVAYLRWTLKATHGTLEPVPADQALREIESLRFSGHVVLDGR